MQEWTRFVPCWSTTLLPLRHIQDGATQVDIPTTQSPAQVRRHRTLYIEQDDDMNSYVTKSHLFGAQRALHQEQQAMSECIDNLATDLRLFEQRTREYFDHKLDDHKQENDARMDEIRALLLNRASSTLSSSRRSRSSRHSDYTISDSSTPTSNTLRHAACQDRQANRNPLHDNNSQEQRHCQNEATFAQA